jgi:multicomponent Na+:H+ antiporter subunit B
MKILRYKPLSLIPIGLGVAVFSMFLPVFWGLPVMTGLWLDEPVPVIGMIGTALFFDIGVYLVVIGAALTILFTISLETH